MLIALVSWLAPVLLLVAVGGIAAVVLRRWLDPVGPAVLLVTTVVVAGLFGPALVGGGTILPVDALRGWVPFRHLPPAEVHGNYLQRDLLVLVAPSMAVVRDSVGAGRWPLRNPRSGIGVPLLGDPQAQAASPLALPALALPPARGIGVLAALQVAAALVGMALFLRRDGFGPGPALLGATAYGLSGFAVLWAGWPIASSAALLPASLWAVSRWIDEGGARDLFLVAIVVLAVLVAGHPETGALVLATVAVWAIARLRRATGGRRRGGGLLLAGTLAAAMASPVLLPAAHAIDDSLRAARLEEGASRKPSAVEGVALRRTVPIASPNVFGNDRYLAYWGPENFNEDAAGFVGTATLVLALAGVVASRRRRSERLALGAAALGVAVVALPGPVGALSGLLPPLLRSPSGHHRILLLVVFGLAVLAAGTVERWREEGVRWVPLLGAGAAVSAAVVGAYLAFRHPEAPETLDVLRRGTVHWQLRAVAALLILAALARGRRWVGFAVVVVVLGELLVLFRPSRPVLPERLAFPEVPPLSVPAESGGRTMGLAGVVPPNVLAVYGIADVRAHGPLVPAGLARIAPELVGPETGPSAPSPGLLDDLGVRWVLAGPDDEVPGAVPAARGPDGRLWERIDAPGILRGGDGSSVSVRWREPERVELLLGDGGPERCVAAVGDPDGWRAAIDGRPVPVRREGSFPAIATGTGKRGVLVYRPRGFLPGCWLAGIGLGVLVALAVPPAPVTRPRGRPRSRRPAAPPPPT